MSDFLFYGKIVLLVVLLYDVGILFRKPEKEVKLPNLISGRRWNARESMPS